MNKKVPMKNRLAAFVLACCFIFCGLSHRAQAQGEMHLPDGSMRPAGWPEISSTFEGERTSGDLVRYIQYLLRARGYRLSVSGTFGPQTERAVRQFQHSQHLKADGDVGQQTWPALTLKIQRGSRGDAVRAAQIALSREGFKGIKVDGRFGTSTQAAVRAVQKKYGLPVDGIIGKWTWCWLIGGTTPNDTTTLY